MSDSSHWITFKTVEIAHAPEELVALIEDAFDFPKENTQPSVEEYFRYLRNDLTVLIEYPYVDNVFRDSYYSYFSSKHRVYSRYCIRLSFFEGEVHLGSFRDSALSDALSRNFLGICVVRPTYPKFFGKTMLSPRALKARKFISCLGAKTFSINGVKLKASCFPHASQDGEYISCAETSLWSIMEYFGNKYPEHTPTLPSEIINILARPAPERMVPSRGLTINQISFALKEFGFASRIYTKEAYKGKEDDFRRILSFYIESGIPVVVGLQNENIGHAVVFVGHTISDKTPVDTRNVSFSLSRTGTGMIDTADFDKQFVVIDDSFPPYQFCKFELPAGYYDDIQFSSLQIAGFVVPLYPKIYLEAYEGFRLALEILDKLLQPDGVNLLVIRFLLTSSRSLKARIAGDPNVDATLKELVILKSMPKFVWMAELSDPDTYLDDKVNGLIVLDATGNGSAQDMLLAVFGGKVYTIVQNHYEIYDLNFGPFGIFRNNLKGEWSAWRE